MWWRQYCSVMNLTSDTYMSRGETSAVGTKTIFPLLTNDGPGRHSSFHMMENKRWNPVNLLSFVLNSSITSGLSIPPSPCLSMDTYSKLQGLGNLLLGPDPTHWNTFKGTVAQDFGVLVIGSTQILLVPLEVYARRISNFDDYSRRYSNMRLTSRCKLLYHVHTPRSQLGNL